VPDAEFSAAVAGILGNPEKLAEMGRAARAHALTASWDSVFEGVYQAYEGILGPENEGQLGSRGLPVEPDAPSGSGLRLHL
jgi:hypothetical protein